VHDVSQLSFWIKGKSVDTISALLVEGYNGSTWVTIDNITHLPSSATAKTYLNVSAYTKFKFTYTKSSGNLAFDDVAIICGTYVGLAEIQDENAISIYPNPATDRVFIYCSNSQNVKMQIFNIVGECVLRGKLNKSTNEVDIRALSPGMYIIKVTGTNWTVEHKLIRE
jgi:hypothetical protein